METKFASGRLQDVVLDPDSIIDEARTTSALTVPSHHAERGNLERFIAHAYFRNYGARVQHFAKNLIGLRDPNGTWLAGAGYTLAGIGSLFVEQYLDAPVEAAIAARLGTSIRREQVVEVGNLAATGAGAARRIIICATALLHQLGRTWVVFTSTRSLLNSFARLDIAPIFLAEADPLRLSDHGKSWGTYYDTKPQVMIANIPLGFVHLLSQAQDRETPQTTILKPQSSD